VERSRLGKRHLVGQCGERSRELEMRFLEKPARNRRKSTAKPIKGARGRTQRRDHRKRRKGQSQRTPHLHFRKLEVGAGPRRPSVSKKKNVCPPTVKPRKRKKPGGALLLNGVMGRTSRRPCNISLSRGIGWPLEGGAKRLSRGQFFRARVGGGGGVENISRVSRV